MKYEDFERAQELRDEVDKLQTIATTLAPDEYHEDEPVIICRKSSIYDLTTGSPVSIPAELARKLSAMVWELAEKKEKEFGAL